MSADLVAPSAHGNLDEQISQLMQCKPLSEPNDHPLPPARGAACSRLPPPLSSRSNPRLRRPPASHRSAIVRVCRNTAAAATSSNINRLSRATSPRRQQGTAYTQSLSNKSKKKK